MENVLNHKTRLKNGRTKTKDMSPNQKFRHLAEIRLYQLENSFKKIGNLANKNYYSYSEAEKNKILNAVRDWYSYMRSQWNKATKKEAKKKRISFWDN
jgi:hypothetical protein|tara:strand:+ start:181 stop:474 length:294 start_codon:yes stop_codon:yes gene_type:complete